MKTFPLCTTPLHSAGLQPLLHGDSVHLHNHCTNQQTTLTKHRSNDDIAQAIQELYTLLSNTPYKTPARHTTFRTTLLTGLHNFDNSPYTLLCGTPCTTPLFYPIPTTQHRTHHSVQSPPQLWAQSLSRVLLHHDAYLTHRHCVVSNLPRNTYTRTALKIIDHLYIGILPAALHSTIRAYLTSVARHQLTVHQTYFRAQIKPPSLITLYYEKAKHNRTLKHAFNVLDITDTSPLAHIYHQAWNFITSSLLQRTRNVQHIVHALVYQQQTKSTLTLPPTPARARTPPLIGRKFATTVLESHRFTNNTTRIATAHPSTPLVEPHSPRRCTHQRCTLTDRLNRAAGTAQGNNIYCQQCHTFNQATHHATRLERTVTTRPYIRQALLKLMFQPRSDTTAVHQTTVNNIIMQLFNYVSIVLGSGNNILLILC